MVAQIHHMDMTSGIHTFAFRTRITALSLSRLGRHISASGTTDALKTVVLIGAMRAYLGPGPPRGGGRGPLIH